MATDPDLAATAADLAEWRPDPRQLQTQYVLLGVLLLLGVVDVVVLDGAGRWVAVLVVLIGAAGVLALRRTAITVDEHGITRSDGLRTRHVPWSEVKALVLPKGTLFGPPPAFVVVTEDDQRLVSVGPPAAQREQLRVAVGQARARGIRVVNARARPAGVVDAGIRS